jgi:hypothetical protein
MAYGVAAERRCALGPARSQQPPSPAVCAQLRTASSRLAVACQRFALLEALRAVCMAALIFSAAPTRRRTSRRVVHPSTRLHAR